MEQSPIRCRVLLIDNYDSYSFNLFHLIGKLTGIEPLMIQNDDFDGNLDRLLENVDPQSFDCVVIGPGPGTPENETDLGLSSKVLNSDAINVPILGVCLGMQAMAVVCGGQIRRAPQPMHGRLSEVKSTPHASILFENISFPFKVVRYHSLCVDVSGMCGDVIKTTSVAADDGVVMSLEHASKPWFGVQYHPESICAGLQGPQIVMNFIQFAFRFKKERSIPKPFEDHSATESSRSTSKNNESTKKKKIKMETNNSTCSLCVLEIEGQIKRSAEGTYDAFFAGSECRAWLDSAMQHSTRGQYSILCTESGLSPNINERIEFYVQKPRLEMNAKHRELRDAGECVLISWRPNSNGKWQMHQVRKGKGCEPFSKINASLLEANPNTVKYARFNGELTGGEWMTDKTVKDLPMDFCGGFVGTIGYGLRKLCGVKNIPDESKEIHESTDLLPHSSRPDLAFFFCDRSVVYDLESNRCFILVVADTVREASQTNWMFDVARFITTCTEMGEFKKKTVVASDSSPLRFYLTPSRTKTQYENDVRRCLEQIYAGETYEVCLTNQLHGKRIANQSTHPSASSLRVKSAKVLDEVDLVDGEATTQAGKDQTNVVVAATTELIKSPLLVQGQDEEEEVFDVNVLYRSLRRNNPAPFCAMFAFQTSNDNNKEYHHHTEVALLSTSPERFLRVDRTGLVESRPIKGTLARGKTKEEDDAQRLALEQSEKDQAENMMIVDLVRNDLGRVCEMGSVICPELFVVESFRTVHQLVSTIRGRLKPGHTSVDAVRCAFPPGSMTGAPKLRTMQIIDDIEVEERGFYSGALGFFSLSGAADFSVIIRTAVVLNGSTVSVGAGGAVIALSDPENEQKEMSLKVRALGNSFELLEQSSESL